MCVDRGTDGYILVLFLILTGIRNGIFQSSKPRDCDHKEPTMFCNLVLFYTLILSYTLHYRWNMWGDELLGGGPNSPSFLLQPFGVSGHVLVSTFIFVALKSRRLVGCT